MDTNYYTLTTGFLGRHKTKIANVMYYPDKKVEYPVGFTYEFMPRKNVDQYTVDSLVAIFNSLVKTARYVGISDDEKRGQIVAAFALYNASNPIFKAPPVPLPRVDEADAKDYERKYLGRWDISEVMKNMRFAELETSTPALPTFTARKSGIMHYFPDAKKIIFNGAATIILWANGTKTVVKCMDGDVYDPEKAVLMAYLEKITGGKGPAKRFLKDCLKDYTPQAGAVNDAETPERTTAEKVWLIRELMKTMTCAEAAAALGVSETTVRRIRKENEV